MQKKPGKRDYSRNIKKAFQLAWLVALLTSVSLAPQITPRRAYAEGEQSTFRVASFNVLGSNHRGNAEGRAKQAERIIEGKSGVKGLDVFGVQEMENDQWRMFDRLIGDQYGHTPNDKWTQTTVYWKKSRFSARKQGVVKYPSYGANGLKPNRYAHWVKLTDRDSGQSFYIINVHLPSWNKDPGSDRGGAQKREKTAEIIMNWAKKIKQREPGIPIVLTGDMNSPNVLIADDKALGGNRSRIPYCILTRDNLLRFGGDAVDNVGFGPCPRNRRVRIDAIYFSEGIKVHSYAILRNAAARAATDHGPMIATVTLTNSQDSPIDNSNLNDKKKCEARHYVWKNNKCTSKCQKGYVDPAGGEQRCVSAKSACENSYHRVWKDNKCSRECKPGYVYNSQSKTICYPKQSSNDKEKPTVTLTAPANGTILSGAVTVMATANDNSGKIEKVEFYRGKKRILVDTSAQYVKRWNTKKVPNGTYELMAKAYDAAGNVGESKKVVVVVDHSVKLKTSKVKLKGRDGAPVMMTLTGSCSKNLKAKAVGIPSKLKDKKVLVASSFTTHCAKNKESVNVKIDLGRRYENNKVKIYKQNGKKLQQITNKTTVADLAQSNTVSTFVSYTITDGGFGDEDNKANTVIKDPVFVTYEEVNSPATSGPAAQPPVTPPSSNPGSVPVSSPNPAPSPSTPSLTPAPTSSPASQPATGTTPQSNSAATQPVSSNANTTVRNADGSSSVTNDDGTVTTTYPDGSTVTVGAKEKGPLPNTGAPALVMFGVALIGVLSGFVMWAVKHYRSKNQAITELDLYE